METIISNYDCAKTRYYYNDSIGNVYEFIRLYSPGFLPSLTVFQCLLDSTAVVPRIIYEVQSNTFIGFTPHVENRLPRIFY
jgi:hypothetical protein